MALRRGGADVRRHRVFDPGFMPGEEDRRLPEEESLHLIRVLRLAPGAEVDVFDGAGREWRTVLTATDRRVATVRIVRERTGQVEPVLRVTLFQALCKFDRMEQVLQKGTELGISEFQPVRTVRAERLRITRNRLDRWNRIVREACKQSGRRVVPPIRPVRDLPADAPPGGVGILPTPGAPPDALDRVLAAPAPRSCGILVGPEGGLDRREIASLEDSGWTATGLGPRILRTETAGIVTASVVLHRWGDLGAVGRG